MNTLPALATPTLDAPSPLVSDGCAEPVLTLLQQHGWTILSTPEANVHCTSPDGRLYVGWLPEDPAAWHRHTLWTIHATPTHSTPWVQEFGPDTPSHAVAGFIDTLLPTVR